MPAQRTGNVTGSVVAGVVDQHDPQRTGVMLAEQRRQTVRQHLSLVPSGDDHGDRGPAAGRLGSAPRQGIIGIKPGVGAPEHSVAAQ